MPRSASLQTDVFASSSGGTQNALFVSTAPYGPDAFYVISVNTPLSNDLYIWLFLDQAIGLDQGGSSLGIQVQRTT